jgi:exopolysaccharide biosynthesis polyprenyl glycosylphosphotransferase
MDQSYAVPTAVEERVAAPPQWLPARPSRSPLTARILQGRIWTALRVGIDAVLITAAAGATLLSAPGADAGEIAYVLLLAPLTIALLALGGLYKNGLQLTLFDGLGRALGALSLATGALITAGALGTPHLEPQLLLAQACVASALALGVARVTTNGAQRRGRASGALAAPALIVGAGQIGAQVERRLITEPELGLQPLGYLDADPPSAEDVPLRTAPVLGRPDELARVADETGARHVVLGFTRDPDSELFSLVRECEERGLAVSVVPRMFEFVNVHHELEHVGGLPLLSLEAVNPKGSPFAVKHAFDRVIAGLTLIALAPVMIAIAVAVKLSSPGPVLFRQRRIGRDGRDFELLKFRSMRMPEDVGIDVLETTCLLPADTAPGGVEGIDRRTAIGTFLRESSLDELPQFINVLRGEMSLVGPRPERPEFVELFESRVRRYDDRHRVKSGITGWAQIHGLRGRTSLSERVEFDNHYIANWSLSLDLKILLLTVGAVFSRGGDE